MRRWLSASAGHPVSLYARAPHRVDSFAGLGTTVARSPAELAARVTSCWAAFETLPPSNTCTWTQAVWLPARAMARSLLVTVHAVVAAEAAALLRRLGVDPGVATGVLGDGWAASAMLVRGLPRALGGDFGSSGATISGLVEVQRLVAELAAEKHAATWLFGLARSACTVADDAGLGDCDPAALVDVYDRGLADFGGVTTP